MLDYIKKGEWIPPPNFRYRQGRPQFNASSSIQNSVPLRIQLKEFMEEINKDTVTKFKAMDKILENIDGKVREVGSSNLHVLNMMKILETQVAQLAGRLSSVGVLTRGSGSLLVNAAYFLVPNVDARGNTVAHGFILVPAVGPYVQQEGVRGHCIICTSEAREGGRLPCLC